MLVGRLQLAERPLRVVGAIGALQVVGGTGDVGVVVAIIIAPENMAERSNTLVCHRFKS